jgi:hypothetical protein
LPCSLYKKSITALRQQTEGEGIREEPAHRISGAKKAQKDLCLDRSGVLLYKKEEQQSKRSCTRMDDPDKTTPSNPGEGHFLLNVGKTLLLIAILVAAWFILDWLIGGK